MRASNVLGVFLAALVLLALFSSLPTATASKLPLKSVLNRRLLQGSTTTLEGSKLHSRQLLQSCSSCPAAAGATCSAASASQLNTIRADLISKCSSSGFSTSKCCALYGTSNWDTYAACAW
jgi:hypothetical protein